MPSVEGKSFAIFFLLAFDDITANGVSVNLSVNILEANCFVTFQNVENEMVFYTLLDFPDVTYGTR